MKQNPDDDPNGGPKELSLGMITRGRHTSRWLQLAALSFAVTGCDLFVEAKTSKDTASLSTAENPTPDAGTADAENPENPTPDAENPTPDAENPTPDAENPTPDAENPTPDAENPENPALAP